jgi:hypothetical protein
MMNAAVLHLGLLLLTAPALGLHGTPPPRRRTGLRATQWQDALDDIDGETWRDLRRVVYGAPDAAAPRALARFEAYCENRRTSLEEEVREDLGGRRLLECQQTYPGLTARPVWDVSTEDWDCLEPIVNQYEDLRDEVRSQATTFRESKWVDTYGRDGAYDSGWGMVDVSPRAFPRIARALRGAPLAPRRRCVARQRASHSIHAHSDRVPWALTCHVTLEGSGHMVVDGARMEWEAGKATVCDTTFFHSAHNEHASEDVYLLHLDVFHPELSGDERYALEELHSHLATARRHRAAALSPFVAGLESAFSAGDAARGES